MRRHKLDAIDLRILSALQREGRLSKTAIAEKVGLSATPCWERLRRLHQVGLIRGYHAEIAVEKLGTFTAVLVEVVLKQHRYEDFERFERTVRGIEAITDCYATGGGIDYLMKIVVPDIDAYQGLIDRLLLSGIGIDRYFTYVITRPVKQSAQVPVDLIIGRQGIPEKSTENEPQ